MSFQYDLESPDEQIFVYKEPRRGIDNPLDALFGTPSYAEPTFYGKKPSWTQKVRSRFRDMSQQKISEPGYWIYSLIVVALLVLVIVALYWILQAARVAIARRQFATMQDLQNLSKSQGSAGSSANPSPTALALSKMANIGRSLTGYDTGKSSSCPSGQCPGNGSVPPPASGPRLTFSPSVGLAPTAPGQAIRGGLGHDLCLGCKCIGCEIPGRCTRSLSPTVGMPEFVTGSLPNKSGAGYARDPYLL
jgi:hypothetical protein